MDTKWKKFSRSIGVRVVVNMLLIVCMITVMLLMILNNQINEKRAEIWKYSEEKLYGNKTLQKKLKLEVKDIVEQVLNAELAGNAEKKKIGQNVDLAFLVKWIDDETGKCHVAEKDYKMVENQSQRDETMYLQYKGMKGANAYTKNWVNSYQGKEIEFSWFKINNILNNICQGNKEYSALVAKHMVEHLEQYKNTIKNNMLTAAMQMNENVFHPISDEVYYSLYGNHAYKETNWYEEYYANSENGGDQIYDYDTGCMYIWHGDRGYEDEYYDSSNSEWKMFRDEDFDVIESHHTSKKDNDEKNATYELTKEDKKNIEENIANALFAGSQYSDYSVEVPISALFDNPREYEIFIAVQPNDFAKMQAPYEKIEKKQESYNKKQGILQEKMTYAFLPIFLLGILCSIYLSFVCGRSSADQKVHTIAIDHWYTEILIGAGLVAGYLTIFFVRAMNDTCNTSNWYICGGVCIFSAYLLLQLYYSLLRKCKAKIFLRESLFATIVKWGKHTIAFMRLRKTFTYIVVGVPVFVLFSGICLFAVFDVKGVILGVPVLCLGIWTLLAIIIYRYVEGLERLQKGIEKVRNGEVSYKLSTTSSENIINVMAQDINDISEGLDNAVSEMVKSERLKTELISNVSHDIKTPLTSIITYVDLMKKEDIKPDKVKEYVKVLDQKSQRLKVLTDDLFEAAKATSGAMHMDITKLDLGALARQALGEFEDKFEKCGLQVRMDVPENQYFVMADGRLAWRILENVFGNVAKYAMPDSRVYVEVEEAEDGIIFMVKNISKTELNISADELLERFTRGDSSRNTEGSGLGLNIAKSLAKLQHGDFYVEIDGDLFKSICKLPKEIK